MDVMNSASSQGGRLEKRRRLESDHSVHSHDPVETKYYTAADVNYLRAKAYADAISAIKVNFERIKAEYDSKIQMAQVENERLLQERQVLRNGVLRFNAKREEMANEIKSLRAITEAQRQKM